MNADGVITELVAVHDPVLTPGRLCVSVCWLPLLLLACVDGCNSPTAKSELPNGWDRNTLSAAFKSADCIEAHCTLTESEGQFACMGVSTSAAALLRRIIDPATAAFPGEIPDGPRFDVASAHACTGPFQRRETGTGLCNMAGQASTNTLDHIMCSPMLLKPSVWYIGIETKHWAQHTATGRPTSYIDAELAMGSCEPAGWHRVAVDSSYLPKHAPKHCIG